jgi:hypothetical protein
VDMDKKRGRSMLQAIGKSFASSFPIVPIFRWGDKSFFTIPLIEMKRNEIILTLPRGMNLKVDDVLRLGRPVGSKQTHDEFQGRLLIITGKARVTKVLQDSRVHVELLRGAIIDAICAEIDY